MKFRLSMLSSAALALLAVGCGGSDDPDPVVNVLGPPDSPNTAWQEYTATAPGAGTSAESQDLLTAGLGKTGLAPPPPPAYADPLNRRRWNCAAMPSTPTTAPSSDPKRQRGYGRPVTGQ